MDLLEPVLELFYFLIVAIKKWDKSLLKLIENGVRAYRMI